ncbi:MAG: hypothetical protein GY775_15955, partial [Candidatus Scalindua sp.]|nr:hypothetical protein [Candidatus Scalindua sp.]
MRKSSRLKPFRVTADSNIKSFIKKFDEELVSMKTMVGIGDVLTNAEYIPIFRGSLDFSVIERVTQVLVKNGSTWEDTTISDLIKLMKEEFGSQQTDVADVLQQFGQSRLVKSCDQKVSEFYFQWLQHIPEVMKPTSDAERVTFVDLIHRAMFYISLEDEFLQKALSDLKEPNPTIQHYYNEACAAESRRQSFQDITQSSTCLENKG